MLNNDEDLIERLNEEELSEEGLGVGFASFGDYYSDLLTTTRNVNIKDSTYNKEHILECIKEGLKYGTIEYKDIILAIKEAKDDS